MATADTIDLAGLPLPQAIEEIDFEAIVDAMSADMVGRYPDIAGVIELEDEPTKANIEVAALRETFARARINDAIRSNLLPFATAADLDNLAVFYGVTRMFEDDLAEDDARFRLRVVLAIQGRSTGGTVPRYRGVALGASLRVADAVVYREGRDPTVKVAVYAIDNGGVADDGLLASVAAALNAPAVRMVNDTISVRAAVFDVVDIAADVWLLPETPDSAIAGIEANLRSSWAAETGLGFDLTPAWITARLMRPGIQKVVVTAPAADVVAAPYRAISLGTVALTNRGRAY